MFKVDNKTPEPCHWRCSAFFIRAANETGKDGKRVIFSNFARMIESNSLFIHALAGKAGFLPDINLI